MARLRKAELSATEAVSVLRSCGVHEIPPNPVNHRRYHRCSDALHPNGGVLFMRSIIVLATLVVCGAPAAARAQSPQPPLKTELQGFGGMTGGTAQFGSAVTPTFGGNVAVDLLPNLQAVGEFGRLNDISSPLFDLLEFTNVGVNVAAWYGDGGVRFITSPGAVARPYGEATFGFARLDASVTGLSGETDEYVNAALDIVNSTRPMLGV